MVSAFRFIVSLCACSLWEKSIKTVSQATSCVRGNIMHECCYASQVKRNHAGLSDLLLRIVRALDGLEGRFAEQSHHHNSKTHQIHDALSQDLTQLEAVLAPNSAGEHDLQ